MSMIRRQSGPQLDPLKAALADCRGAFWAVALFSGVLNVLAIAGSIYMLQVYDRVLTSRSLQTLVALTAILVAVFAIQAALDAVRQRLMTRIGAELDRKLAPRMFDMLVTMPTRIGPRGDPMQPIRDLDSIRAFFSGLGPTALFDLPWMPIFLGLCFLMHPWLGLTALAGCILLIIITLMTERSTKEPITAVVKETAARHIATEATRRNAEAIMAMGMQGALAARFATVNNRFLAANAVAADAVAGYGSVSKSLRMFLQSAILGVGAYLVIKEQATPGVMIAASILMGRALAPIEIAIAHWRGFVAARQARHRLGETMKALPVTPEPMPLPAPKRMVTIDQVFTGAPGATQPIIHGVSLSLLAGQALGVIGPSASGKSTLARTLAGAWAPLRGSVRLDGAELTQWGAEARGAFIGYLPQDIELFDGTVAENIARFRADADPKAVVEAARIAGADETIRALPDGYETRIGEGGAALSGGQRQRVALARALYGDPFLVILDEPNANLDADGEKAVTEAIRHVRGRGGVCIVVAHRPSALSAVDQVAVMREGKLTAFGPRDEVLRKVLQPGQGGAGPGQGPGAPTPAPRGGNGGGGQ